MSNNAFSGPLPDITVGPNAYNNVYVDAFARLLFSRRMPVPSAVLESCFVVAHWHLLQRVRLQQQLPPATRLFNHPGCSERCWLCECTEDVRAACCCTVVVVVVERTGLITVPWLVLVLRNVSGNDLSSATDFIAACEGLNAACATAVCDASVQRPC